MFKKILIPTDGSALATQAALEGIELAKKVGAEVVCVFVAGENQNAVFDFAHVKMDNHWPTDEEYEKVITAVTESRTQLYIKIKAGYIVGYSRGLNQLGKHDWTFVPNVSYTKTFQNREFAYTANVGGTRIYFNM